MAHLGADLTAYVDGQLPASAAREVDAHLEQCADCAQLVRQQKLLKSRLGTSGAPSPSSELLANLTALPATPDDSTFTDKVRRVGPVPAVLVLVGASFAVAVVAFVVGAGGRGDAVRPPVEEYAAEFFGATSTATAAGYSDDAVAELNEQGWSCADSLAGDLHRTTTGYDTAQRVILVTYTNGTQRLRLYEQPGALDPSRLEGFERDTIGGADVWIDRAGPTVITWDRGGVVYTVVTDADEDRVDQAIAELPTPEPRSMPQRVGDGLQRLSTWIDVAA